MMPNWMPDVLQFDEFELDKAAFELRRAGRVVRLERIPLELLFYLTERRGQLVSREEILERIWGKDVFVDADNAINTAIRKIRQALREDTEKPRYLVPVTGKGYRFTADFAARQVAPVAASPGSAPPPNRWRRSPLVATTAVLILATGAYIVRWLPLQRTSTTRLASLEE